MRDPCPYCRMPGIAFSRFDRVSREIVRDIRNHDCPAFARPEPLTRTPTDTSFIREARNTPEGLLRWREGNR